MKQGFAVKEEAVTLQEGERRCDGVKVCKEDTALRYPDLDKVITRCSESVVRIATIARELGIEIASAIEAMERLGLRSIA